MIWAACNSMGRVSREKNEPVFHAEWEARVYALNRAAAAGGRWNLDASRYEIEVIPPADYLRMSYYERWHVRLVELLIKRGMVTRAEVESGKPAPDSRKATPVMNAGNVPSVFAPANPERPQAGSLRASLWASAFVRATFIPLITPASRVMCVGSREPFGATTASLSSPILMLISPAKIRSMYIRCALQHGNFGGNKLLLAIPSTLICGTTILNSPDPVLASSGRLDILSRLPLDKDGPVFAEPWQAQAFALAVKLSEQGHFTWKESAGTLSEELQAAASRGEPDDGSHYYEHWLAALERLVTSKGLTRAEALAERKEAWADAYRHTPHGKPVELRQRSTTS